MLQKDKFVKLPYAAKLALWARHDSLYPRENWVVNVAEKSRIAYPRDYFAVHKANDSGWFLGDVIFTVRLYFTPDCWYLKSGVGVDLWYEALRGYASDRYAKIAEVRAKGEALIRDCDCEVHRALYQDRIVLLDYLKEILDAMAKGAKLDWETMTYSWPESAEKLS